MEPNQEKKLPEQTNWLERAINQSKIDFQAEKSRLQQNRQEAELYRESELTKIRAQISNAMTGKAGRETQKYLDLLATPIAEHQVNSSRLGNVGVKADIDRQVTNLKKLNPESSHDWGVLSQAKKTRQGGGETDQYAENDDLYHQSLINKAG